MSGGTGSGKTTTLNALSGAIPGGERIVTVEDAAELRLRQRHVVRLESRPANLEGRGEVTIRQLVRNALRMRPDRIVVGEVRGPEALDMLQALNTGHDGSLTTVHANSPEDALRRVETLALMAGVGLPHGAVREQVASALDLVVHQTRAPDGSRRVSSVCEVVRVAGGAGTRELLMADGRVRARAGEGAARAAATARVTARSPSPPARSGFLRCARPSAGVRPAVAGSLAGGGPGGGGAGPRRDPAGPRGPRPRGGGAAPAPGRRGAAAFFGGFVALGPLPGLAAAAAGPWAVARLLRARRERYRRAVDEGAAAAAIALADALGGGHSLRGALGEAAEAVPGAAGHELRRARAELAAGARTEAALEALRARARSPRLDSLVAACLLQQRAGGDLARLLRGLARSFEDQSRLEDEVRAATAQARFTGLVVVLLPLAGAGLAELASPGFLQGWPSRRSPPGWWGWR